MENSIARSANFAGLMEIPNLRRMSICELVCKLQDIHLDRITYYGGSTPQSLPNTTIYLARLDTEIRRELTRRQDMPDAPANTNTSIIKALKERADMVEVLGQFTEVFTYKKQWTYRCTLHGEDKHPSGVIYKDTNKAHCFACNKGGDVLDIVGLFSGHGIEYAIDWLCRFYGIDFRIMPTERPEHVRFIRALEQ